MDRKAAMRSVLDAEVKRWSAMSIDQLASRLSDSCNYQLEQNGTVYQFEVEILERKPEYIHVCVSVDDGRLLYSMIPLCQSFVKREQQSEF